MTTKVSKSNALADIEITLRTDLIQWAGLCEGVCANGQNVDISSNAILLFCLGADFEQGFETGLYVSYFFETFPFLFRKIRRRFLTPMV